MKHYLILLIFTTLLLACGQENRKSTLDNTDTTRTNSPTTEVKSIDIFADSVFTFLSIDSIDEEMLRDRSDEKEFRFLKNRKSFKQAHCDFFKIGCTNSFWDDYTFLVAKQNKIDDILPVIIHTSSDFDYYHSELHTLDKALKKIDVVVVSLDGFDKEPDDDYGTVVRIKSKFVKDKIITTELKFRTYRTEGKDSVVTVDSTIVYRRIDSTGHIIKERSEKII